MTADPTAAASTAVLALSEAFYARDVDAAVACFADHRRVAYAGSEACEVAVGPVAVRALLGRLFARDEAYSWAVERAHSAPCGDALAVLADLTGRAHSGAGVEEFAYRLSGLVVHERGAWRWLLCHGAEPAGAPAAPAAE